MKLILTGVTGFLGGELLRQALEDDAIDEVLALTRRPLERAHPKLKSLQPQSFLDYSGIDLAGYDACVWSLGVSQGAVSEPEYIEITVGYALAAAKALFAANPRARFCFVSGRSADPDEKSPKLFARIKGRAERELASSGENVFVFRPAYIKPTARSGPRRDLARLFAPVGALISLLVENFSVDCDQLAACLLDVAQHGTNDHLLLNATIRSWPSSSQPISQRSAAR